MDKFFGEFANSNQSHESDKILDDTTFPSEGNPSSLTQLIDKSYKSGDECWNRFLDLVKQEDKVQDEPRKAVYVDADIHKTLLELGFTEDKKAIAHVLNAIVRSFLEKHINELKPFRKSNVVSIFESYHKNA